MWDKMGKIKWQIIGCTIIIVASYAIAVYGAINGIHESAQRYIDKVSDIALFGAIAWLLNSAQKVDSKKE